MQSKRFGGKEVKSNSVSSVLAAEICKSVYALTRQQNELQIENVQKQ
jgi:hypothetical protein